MKNFLHLIRIKQWIKNLFFISAPLIFSLQLFDKHKTIASLLTCVSFSFITVFVYIINDIKDRHNDAQHPLKSSRPIAAGKIHPIPAFLIGCLFAIVGIIITCIVNPTLLIIIFIYVLLNLAYSLFLKKIAILDVLIIATGFCLRVLLGSVAIDVVLSHWMLLTTFSISMVLGFGKRRNELLLLGDDALQHRSNLKEYTVELLNIMIIISTAITALSYALYTMDNDVISHLKTDDLIYTVPFVIYGIFRYLYLIFYKEKGGKPEELVVSDPGIIISVVLWLLVIISLIYFKDILKQSPFYNMLSVIQKLKIGGV